MTERNQQKPKVVFRAFPMTLLLCFLGLIYIGNVHRAERYMRTIDQLEKDVRSLKWEYNSAHADLMYLSTESSVSKEVRPMDLKIADDKPVVISSNP